MGLISPNLEYMIIKHKATQVYQLKIIHLKMNQFKIWSLLTQLTKNEYMDVV